MSKQGIIINTRSPFYIKSSASGMASGKIEIYIYEGTYQSSPSSSYLKYTITKSTLGTEEYVVFEVSELIRDYIDVKYDGEYDSYCVWVRAALTRYNSSGISIGGVALDYIATDGYGYFEEGVNPEPSRTLLQSNKIIYRPSDYNVNIPIFAEDTNSVAYLYNNTTIRTDTISDNDNTNQKIQYIYSYVNSDTDTYQERVLNDNGTLEESICLDKFLRNVDTSPVDKIIINSDTSSEVVEIRTLDCSIYDPIKVTFVNKYGALQDLWFDKKSVNSIEVQSNDYKASVMDFSSSPTYDTSAHQNRVLDLVGKESITMNTGYIDEEYNEVFRQLMLSEQVWMTRLTDTEEVLPLRPRTQSLQFKTRTNDKLVNYTVEFDFAFDKINTIR